MCHPNIGSATAPSDSLKTRTEKKKEQKKGRSFIMLAQSVTETSNGIV